MHACVRGVCVCVVNVKLWQKKQLFTFTSSFLHSLWELNPKNSYNFATWTVFEMYFICNHAKVHLQIIYVLVIENLHVHVRAVAHGEEAH